MPIGIIGLWRSEIRGIGRIWPQLLTHRKSARQWRSRGRKRRQRVRNGRGLELKDAEAYWSFNDFPVLKSWNQAILRVWSLSMGCWLMNTSYISLASPPRGGAEESIVIIPLSFVTEKKNFYIYGNLQKDACNIFYISIIYYKVLYIIVIDVIWIWIY